MPNHTHTHTIHTLAQGYLMNVRVQLQIARCLCEIIYLYYCAVVNKDIRAHNQKQIKQIDRDNRRKRQRERKGEGEHLTLRSRYKSAGKVQRIKKARNNKTFDTKIKLTYTLTYATSTTTTTSATTRKAFCCCLAGAVQKSQWDVKDLSEEGGGGEGNKKTETKQNINL